MNTMVSSVSVVNAHLREIPRDPGDFRVVLTFHHAAGSLCEAELKPVEAARLISEIVHVIDQGVNRRAHATRTGSGTAHDD